MIVKSHATVLVRMPLAGKRAKLLAEAFRALALASNNLANVAIEIASRVLESHREGELMPEAFLTERQKAAMRRASREPGRGECRFVVEKTFRTRPKEKDSFYRMLADSRTFLRMATFLSLLSVCDRPVESMPKNGIIVANSVRLSYTELRSWRPT